MNPDHLELVTEAKRRLDLGNVQASIEGAPTGSVGNLTDFGLVCRLVAAVCELSRANPTPKEG